MLTLFWKVWEFVKRHRRKLIFTGVIVIGGRYLYSYTLKKLKDFQEKETAELLASARRQHHFDSNQRTCNMTALSMLPTLRQKLISILNTEEITEQLKANPSNKIQLWEDLKILSFTRVITVVYGCTLMCLMLRVQLNIIGGYMYVDNVKQHKGKKTNTVIHLTPSHVQERYLGLIREFLDSGICDLVAVVQEAVFKETQSFSLKEKLSLHNIETLVKHIRERVEHEPDHHMKTVSSHHHTHLCKYLINRDRVEQIEDELYESLLKETQEILESPDFQEVLRTALDKGFSKMVDYVADFFKQAQKDGETLHSIHEVAVPMAKLIPFMSRLLLKLGSDAPNPLVQELLLLEQTKTLAANIYEAFSQVDATEDPQFGP